MLRIMPRQQVYFDCFERCAQAGVEAANILDAMLKSPERFDDHVARIEALEQAGDAATAEVVQALTRNLATPFERAQIRDLMESLDDVLDATDTIAHKLVMYRAQNVRPEALELSALLRELTPETLKAAAALRTGKNAEAVLVHCREVHRLESDADKVLRRGIAALFTDTKDAIELIKWKEILEILEHATDKCEDAVKIIEEVVRANT